MDAETSPQADFIESAEYTDEDSVLAEAETDATDSSAEESSAQDEDRERPDEDMLKPS